MQALVIDDSRATRRIVGLYLKELGFDILEAGDGQQALDALVEHGLPDVVMVDWNMPVMNGLDFIKAVRSDKANRDLPIIMLTTETEMERMALAFLAGVNEYIMKPFSRTMIEEKLSILGIGV
ncbi:MAG: response regulator [Pirellula sp.]|jgi:two-component system chemotaxis response regulator CheY|nr:response regulator [Pirellula sp.]